MQLLNLGCGRRFHRDWKNLDFVSTEPSVQTHDLRLGLPFGDNEFDAVYHSHVLEHFTKLEGEKFINECYRVLKPNGVIRVVVPDLEQIARLYLQSLSDVIIDQSPLSAAAYDWSVVELIDQMVRESSGGEMKAIWSQELIINEKQIVSRVGQEFIGYRKSLATQIEESLGTHRHSFMRTAKVMLKRVLLKLLQTNQSDVDIGRFRNCGECHKWMYDRFSLSRLLTSTGFRFAAIKTPIDSEIPNWSQYKVLDVEGGDPRKPDSLYMEAVK